MDIGTIDTSEKWQVEVAGSIYEAGADELPSWIAEGSLQPTDKVRKGNLRWIEASKVPAMMPLFEAKAKGSATSARVETPREPHEGSSVPVGEFELEKRYVPQPRAMRPAARPNGGLPLIAELCSIHKTETPAFVCGRCGAVFCKECPASYGGSVKICPACGAMCRSIDAVRATADAEHKRTAAIARGFGFADFLNALSHPLRFKFSLFAGAAMFTVFSIGRSVSVLGGVAMMAASLFCVLLANMLTFGVLAHTADAFSRGNVDRNFMPDFEEFDLIKDVVHPFGLSVATYVSAFGAFAIVFVIGMYLVTSSVDSKMSSLRAEVEKIPGTQFYTAKDTAKQSDEVKELLAETQRQNAERLRLQNEIAGGISPIDQNSYKSESRVPDADNINTPGRGTSLVKTEAAERREAFQSALGLPPVFVVIGAFALVWGLFYFPAACIVAGFTRTFSAAVNPLVGLDTIRRIGGTYAKMLLMGLSLLTAFVAVNVVCGISFAAFDLPVFGNLPATIVTSFAGFYLWCVFCCVIGYGLFKSSDRLQLNR